MTALSNGISIVNSPNASAQLSALQTPEQFAIAKEKERRRKLSEIAEKFLHSNEQRSIVTYGQAYEPVEEAQIQEPKSSEVPAVNNEENVKCVANGTLHIEFSQKKGRIRVHVINLNSFEKELKYQLSIQEITLEKVWNTFDVILESLIPRQIDIVRPSRLDPNTFIHREVGCVTMIMPFQDRYGHAELIFEYIKGNRYVTSLAHIKPLGETAVHASSSAPTDSAEAAVEEEDWTNDKLKVFAQTETWLVSTQKITEVICSLVKKQVTKERIPFIRTGRGTVGAPESGDNCLTYLKYDTLPLLGIHLYKEYEAPPNYICPSEEMREDSIFSKRKISVVEGSSASLAVASSSSLSTEETRLGFKSIDVTREIHEQVLQKAKEDAVKKKKPSEELAAAQRRLSSWKCEELVYNDVTAFSFFNGIIDLSSVCAMTEEAVSVANADTPASFPRSSIMGTNINLIANFSWFPFLRSFVFPVLAVPVVRRGEKEKLEVDVSAKVRLESWFQQMESRIEKIMTLELKEIKQFSMRRKIANSISMSEFLQTGLETASTINGMDRASLTTESAPSSFFSAPSTEETNSSTEETTAPDSVDKPADEASSTTETSSTSSYSSTSSIEEMIAPDPVNKPTDEVSSTTETSSTSSFSSTSSTEETSMTTFGENTGIVIKNSPGATVTSLTQVIVQNSPTKTSKQDVPEDKGCTKEKVCNVATGVALIAGGIALTATEAGAVIGLPVVTGGIMKVVGTSLNGVGNCLGKTQEVFSRC